MSAAKIDRSDTGKRFRRISKIQICLIFSSGIDRQFVNVPILNKQKIRNGNMITFFL